MYRAHHEPPSYNADPSNLFSFDGWLRGRGLTRTTGYRYRQQGLIHTVNLYGRLYVTRDEIEKFETRVIGGEFEKVVKPPGRPPAATVADRRSVKGGKSGDAATASASSPHAKDNTPHLN